MNPDKQIILDELMERINGSPFVIVAEYGGITVDQFTELRKCLREAGSSCHVAKNTFVKRVLRDQDAPQEMEDTLTGQTAIITGDADICAAAKALNKFIDENKKPTLKSGLLDGKFMTAEEVSALADLPPKEVLQSKLLGMMLQPGNQLARVLNEPGTQLARVLNEPGAQLARVLEAKKEKG